MKKRAQQLGLSPKGTVPRARQRGYVLLTVIVMLVVVAVITFLVSYDSSLKASMPAREAEASRADYVAEAAMQHALWRVGNNSCMGDVTIPPTALGADSYAATVTGAAAATAYVLASDQDAWIRNDDVTKNNGGSADQHIRFESGKIEQTLTRFDLSTLPSGAQINTAVAWFYVSTGGASGGIHPEGPLTVHRVTSDWTELGATWETMGGNSESSTLATIPAQAQAGVWVSFNLTGQVQAWVNGQANYGILMASTAEGVHGKYASREDGANPPRLEVVVGSGPASPVSVQATGTLDTGIVRTLGRTGIPAHQPSGGASLEPVADVYLKQDAASLNFGAAWDLWVEDPGAGGSADTSLLRFNLALIPRGARVTSATLEVYAYLDASNSPGSSIGVHRVTRDWVAGTNNGGSGSGATWNDSEPGTPWSSAGGDYDVTPLATTSAPAGTAGWYRWDVTHLVNGWSSGTYPNQGLILVAENDSTLVGFRSGDYTNASQRPKLTITYACDCGSACMAPQGSGKVLMVVINPTTLVAADAYKKALFESWGYAVNVISESANAAAYAAAVASNDVVFISETVNSNQVGNKLVNVPIGVVSQDGAYNGDLGFAGGSSWTVNPSINVTDASNYITAVFPTGPLDIYSGGMEQLVVSGGAAAGLTTLADTSGAGSLVLLDTGAALFGGGSAAGRRVMLPLGREGRVNWDYLNNNGQLIVQRALVWAAGLEGGAANSFIVSTDSDATLGGLSFQDTDVARYQPATDNASLFLDSVSAGMTKKIDALHVLENGHLILSVDGGTTFAGLSVSSEDLFEYDPVAGTATMYLEADVHFESKKDIISVHVLDNGNTVLSVSGNAILGGLAFSDRDLVEYNRFTGQASIYFDGDATTLSQRISALHILANGHIVMAPEGDTTLGGLSFGPDQLVDYDPVEDLAVLYFDGESLFSATSEKVTAVHIGGGSGSSVPSIGTQQLLFVVGSVGGAGPTMEELAHRTLIESWDYSIELIDDDASQAEFDIAVANNDVVFTTNDITASNLNTKLVGATIGVVTSEDNLSDEFGLSSSIGWGSANYIGVVDNTHYITLPFETVKFPISSASESLAYLTGTLSPDLGLLAEAGGGNALVTLESGATTYSGGTAAGRRAQLPWGGNGFDPNNLNADGLTILRRALEWGAGAVVAPDVHLSTDSDAILGGLSFQDTDVARYQSTTDMADLYLDSIAAGLSNKVDALHILADGHLILSTQADTTFGGLTFKSEDLIEYDPVAGTATMYLEANVHFDSMKDIISVHILDNGNAVLSTNGNAILGGLAFSDRDLVEYDRSTGTASIFFDGDATTLSQRISAVHIQPNGNIILAPEGDTTLGGLSFGPDQLVEYNPVLDAAILYFDGETLFSETSEKVRSVHIGPGSGGGGGGGGTIDIQVAADDDDAEEISATGWVDLISSDLELAFDTGTNPTDTAGMRFTNIVIPQGATIDRAYVQFQVDETDSGGATLSIEGEAANDALQFTTANFNISSRTRTAASVPWTPPPWPTVGEAGLDQRTPDIAIVIQEIVDAPGWSSGNALVVIITGTGTRTAESYKGDPLGAPILHVEYGGGGGGGGGGPGFNEVYAPWSAGTDDTWETVDLAPFGVAANAVVEVAVVNSDGGKELWGGVRAVGSTLDRRLQLHEAEDGGSDIMIMTVQADASSRIEHYSDNSSDVTFSLLGYWGSGSFVESWDYIDPGVSGTWTDYALNTYGVAPGSVTEILAHNGSSTTEVQGGVRSNGSSINRQFDIHEAESGGKDLVTLLVNAGTDAGATIEFFVEHGGGNFYLLGHWSTPPGVFTESYSELSGSPASSATWDDKNLTSLGVPANAVVQIVMANGQDDAEALLGVREKGSSNERTLNLQEAEAGGDDLASIPVTTDANSTIQWYDQNTGEDHRFYLLGWWVLP